jgi:acyl-coenzyme A synthetase/AMP-(fatty) acid ligase/thioester reductase-like protein
VNNDFITHLRSQPADAKALEWGQQACTYGQLWEQASQVAGALRQGGVGPDKLVGLRIPKSIDYVVALLGCWWAGAAYVPLDPALPEGRLQAYQQTCAPDLVLDCLPCGPAVTPCAPGELAYVYCTSGSSGSPKAVEIGWGGLTPMLRDQIRAFGLGPGKRMLWLLSIQFDASLSDLGVCLLSGATLVIPQDDQPLPATLRRLAITHLDIPPALLKVYRPEEFPESLETLVAGGEPSDPARLRQWAQRYQLINVYGPTEATICTSLCPVDEHWQAPRLGLPLAEMEHRIHHGELLIGGPGLFLGYRNRPDLSDAACLWLDGRRYYRSGDRVEALAHGDCLFLGRLDRQVKVRGHRIELEEVESVCRGLNGVQRCVAEVVEGDLALYYVGPAQPHEIRTQLARQLPPWMLPGRISALESMPETPTGKPDRSALPHYTCLDSLASLELAARLQAMGHPVTAVQIMKGNPLGMSTAQLRAELPPPVPAWDCQPGWGRSVLLTGASGHLGSRLLERFLAAGMEVYALWRGEPPGPRPGVTFVAGDLSQKLDLDALCQRVDTVFHCAAQVHTVLPWDSLRAVNLDCLPQLLRFCQQGKPKAFHHASTLSVFVSSDFQGRARLDDRLEGSSLLYGGYAQTKWAAERYLHSLDGPIFVYRYGLLTAHSRTGESGPRDFLRVFARGLMGLGCYPEGGDIYLDMTPIDYAVEATWRLAHTSQGRGTYHIASPHRVSLIQLARALGLASVSAERFFALPTRHSDQAAAQLALCRLHPNREVFERNRSLDLFQRSQVDFELSPCAVDFPPLNLSRSLGVG